MFNLEIIEKIKNGKIGVLPTDTLYGFVTSALNKDAVEKLRLTRGRADDKPLIVLISSINDFSFFNIKLDEQTKNILEKIWPAQVSIELPVSDKKFQYLTRGTGHFAVRFPDNKDLTDLIQKTGPLVAPSVNTPGNPPAETIAEAKTYFPDLDFYVDAGVKKSGPSTLISIENGKAKIYRQGVWQVPDFLK